MDFQPFPATPDISRSSSSRHINNIRTLLHGAWEVDLEFFPKFFPVNTQAVDIHQTLQRRLRRRDRWKAVPEKEPKLPSNLYTPLRILLNDILRSSGLYEDTRRFLNTSRKRVYPDHTYPVRPSLILAGCGKHFTGSDTQRPMPHYGVAIAAVEVSVESQNHNKARDRLATAMQRLFFHQYNRRYAFGMVITQQTLTVYMFDRSGVVSSPQLNYHAHPVQFCAIISGLASLDPTRIGLDTSLFKEANKGRIRTRQVDENGMPENKVYTVETLLYYSADFRGNGTTCFQVYEDAAPNTFYVIKDSWVRTEELHGRESEASLLLHAQRQGVLKGIPQIKHSEEVQVVDDSGRVETDTVFHNRQNPEMASKLQRVHTRLILTPYGKPLDHFSSKTELLLAYHDVIQAHRALHDLAGILHRDIKPANILINPRGGEGGRGILIDFDHAIRVGDTSPYSTKKKIGTYSFMSANALQGTHPQTCLDDLESFYYVLLWIVLGYTREKVPTKEVHPFLLEWGDDLAYKTKIGIFLSDFEEKLEPWFGKPFDNLVHKLHNIFKTYRFQCIVAEAHKNPRPVLDSGRVYDQFISAIQDAISELETERNMNDMTRKEVPEKSIQGKLAPEEDDLDTWNLVDPQDREDTDIPHTAASSRPRRNGVNYGITQARLEQTLKGRSHVKSNSKRPKSSKVIKK